MVTEWSKCDVVERAVRMDMDMNMHVPNTGTHRV